ncbi:hypothetical protein V1478_013532 [Vespula squamosa]|uniref:Uncharacterized protein n=1 Tax=Vespula squamosa TaxID=30214 RepID=A0ABD2A5J2_VESSQ
MHNVYVKYEVVSKKETSNVPKIYEFTLKDVYWYSKHVYFGNCNEVKNLWHFFKTARFLKWKIQSDQQEKKKLINQFSLNFAMIPPEKSLSFQTNILDREYT